MSSEPSVAVPVTVIVYVPAGVPPVAVLEVQHPDNVPTASAAERKSATIHALRRRRYLGMSKSAMTAIKLSIRLPVGNTDDAVVLLGAVVWITNSDFPEPSVIVEGLKVHVLSLGSPEQVNATSRVKPVSGTTATA